MNTRSRSLAWDATTAIEALAAADAALWIWTPSEDQMRFTGATRALGLGPLDREEHNVVLGDAPPSLAPRPELHAGSVAGARLVAALQVAQGPLVETYGTEMNRVTRNIAFKGGVVELALDTGRVVARRGTPQQQEARICELELELRQGEPEALLELAAELAADLPLMPCDISKAERGYRLYDANSYHLSLPAPALSAELPLDDAFAALAWHLLGSSQRLAEQYRFNSHWKLLADWLQQLIDLRALIGSLGQAAPRASSHDLREALDALLGDWRPRVRAGEQDEAVRHAAPQQFAEELAGTRWGLFSLNTSRWLLTRAWTVERNERGNRQGKAVLGNWLPRLLAEEGEALKLDRYKRQPEDLSEQLPRIERLLVWLRLARQVLEVPEVDRAYGELAKLAELAAQPLDAEVLAARSEQAQALISLRSWKALTR